MGLYAQTEANTILTLRHQKGYLPVNRGSRGDEELMAFARFLEQCASGAQPGDAEIDIHRGSTDARAEHATGTLVGSSLSGTVGGTFNGVAVTVSTGASDIATMTSLVAAILASSNALVQGLLGASNLGATITLASVAAGEQVAIRHKDSNEVVFNAVSRSNPGAEEFDVSGNDTADATSLAAQINAHRVFKGRLLATSSSGVVTVRQLNVSTTSQWHLRKNGAGITLSGASLAATATALIWALQKGKLGNCITLAASGTGMTASGARLTGGVGGDAVTPLNLIR